MIQNPELLDVVRKLRSYISTLDNSHLTFESLKDIDDINISSLSPTLQKELINISSKLSSALKTIENTKQYKEMVKHYNME